MNTTTQNVQAISLEFHQQKVVSIFGIFFFFSGLLYLFYNEGTAVNNAHALDEILNSVILLNPFEPIRPEYNGRIVYMSAPIQIDEPLTEPEYGISVQAVKLKRRVQMYQWIEERTSEPAYGDQDESYNYYYDNDWRDKLVDSTRFYIRAGHQNPKEIPIKSQIQVSDIVKIGPLILSKTAKDKFTDYFEITSDERPERRDIKMHMGLYYHTDDVWNPEVGDIRLQFSYAAPSGQTVTVVGLQKGDTIQPYVTALGQEILMVRPHVHTVEQMFHMEHADLRWRVWKMRGIGWLLLFIATNCLSTIVKIILSRVRAIRKILILDSTIYTNLVVASSFSLLTVATAWTWQRPLIGFGLIMAAAAPFLYFTLSYNEDGYPVPGIHNRHQYKPLVTHEN